MTFDNARNVEIGPYANFNEIRGNQINVTVGDLNKGIVSHQGNADE